MGDISATAPALHAVTPMPDYYTVVTTDSPLASLYIPCWSVLIRYSSYTATTLPIHDWKDRTRAPLPLRFWFCDA